MTVGATGIFDCDRSSNSFLVNEKKATLAVVIITKTNKKTTKRIIPKNTLESNAVKNEKLGSGSKQPIIN